MNEQFVVYLTIYTGDKLPPFYIGSTSKKKLENGYFGSIRSKKWKKIYDEEIKKHQNLFRSIILSEHDDRKIAIQNEMRIQNELNVVKSNLFFNESIASPNGFFGRDMKGENNPFFGKIHLKEVQDKITTKMKTTMSDPVWKEKFSSTQKEVQNLDRNRIRNSENQKIAQMRSDVVEKKRKTMIEKFSNEDFKSKHKNACQTDSFKNAQKAFRTGKKWIKNEDLNIHKYVTQEELEIYLIEGWTIGMLKRKLKTK